jgi:tetratricopeptide (TPR) repeat protein
MLGFAWLTLRQAQEALRGGRLEEAQRLLAQPAAQGHRRAGPLLAQLARAFVERGDRLLRHDDDEGAWRDLLAAEHLQVADKGAAHLRQALTRLGIAAVRAQFQAGDLRRADEAVSRLRERGVRSPELQVLEDAVKGWLKARDLADHGEHARALEGVERLRRLILGPVPALDAFAVELQKRQQDFAGLLVRLHEALDAGQWREVVERAEQVLALAPQHAEARKARARAWKAIEPVTVAMRPPEPNGNGCETQAATGRETQGATGRYLLWIDGVGGYLVCLGSRLTLGQATLDPHADVPLVADVSRLHATLTRDAEGYLLEAVRPVQVNGQATTRALLRAGDRVTLGTSCQFQFLQPVPVSASARLDLVSGHRLPVAVDAVLLMADTLVLGSGPQVHITVPDLKQPVVLFRYKEGLGLRHGGRLSVNGERGGDRALLPPQAVINGDEVAFALEPVGARLGQA